MLLQEAYRHYKPIGSWGKGNEVVAAAGVGADAPGVLAAKAASPSFISELVRQIGLHRAWDRPVAA